MKVLRISPRQCPEIVEIDGALESLQKEVGGPIQAVYPWNDPAALICNEEAKVNGFQLEDVNRVLLDDFGGPCDVIVGTFLIVGLTEDGFGSLDEALIAKFELFFRLPETFQYINGGKTLKISLYNPKKDGAK